MICKFDFSMKLSSNGWQTTSIKRHLSLTACAWFNFRQQFLEEISSRRCKQMLHLRPDFINSLSCTPAASRVPQKQVPNIHLQASRLCSSSSSRSWRGLTRREHICNCAISCDSAFRVFSKKSWVFQVLEISYMQFILGQCLPPQLHKATTNN